MLFGTKIYIHKYYIDICMHMYKWNWREIMIWRTDILLASNHVRKAAKNHADVDKLLFQRSMRELMFFFCDLPTNELPSFESFYINIVNVDQSMEKKYQYIFTYIHICMFIYNKILMMIWIRTYLIFSSFRKI